MRNRRASRNIFARFGAHISDEEYRISVAAVADRGSKTDAPPPSVAWTQISLESGAVVPAGIPVIAGTDGRLGTMVSSQRFKDDIKPMDKASESILALKPVTFHYKKELDPRGAPQFGLVAEQVEKIDPDLVVRDVQGKPYSVRYEMVNAMLLNEFLKEHRRVQELEAAVAQQRKDSEANAARQQKQIDALTAGLQKVGARLEVQKPSPQTALNNQ